MPEHMTVEEAKRILVGAGLPVSEEKRLGNDSGTQIVILRRSSTCTIKVPIMFKVRGRRK